jgi:hypothetical protein
MAHDVFICYASRDKSIADAVCATLEANRIRCWVAPRDVLPGMGYAEALIEAISESRMMVLVFSSSSNNSPQVLREVERAASKGIPLLPFRIQDVPLSRAMEYYISTHHWLDALTPPLERHLQHLAETVKLLLARTVGPEDLGEELRAPRKAPAAEMAAEQGPETRAAEKRRLVLPSLGLVLARVGLRTRAAASGLGHLVERLRIAPRVLFAVTAGLGGGGIAAILLVLFVFVGQDSGGDSLPEATAQVAAVAPTPSPTPTPTPTPTPLPSPAPTKEADEDGDTVPDASDNCPNTYNPDQANTYGDERGDACEPAPPPPDGDNDTVPDASDNCPSTYNPDQANTYGDERGDACEPAPPPPDGDDDTVPDASDNCPSTYNPDQANTYGDGRGDACEPTPTPAPTPTPTPAPPYAIASATYTGTHSAGGTVKFVVSADGTSVKDIYFSGVPCGDGNLVAVNIDGPIPLDNDAFTVGGEAADLSLSGSFPSAGTAEGTLAVHHRPGQPACTSGTLGWSATTTTSTALDLATGERRWLSHTGDRVYSSPVVVDGVVYIGSSDGYVYAMIEEQRAASVAFVHGGRPILPDDLASHSEHEA